jgi:hypothetical protein
MKMSINTLFPEQKHTDRGAESPFFILGFLTGSNGIVRLNTGRTATFVTIPLEEWILMSNFTIPFKTQRSPSDNEKPA